MQTKPHQGLWEDWGETVHRQMPAILNRRRDYPFPVCWLLCYQKEIAGANQLVRLGINRHVAYRKAQTKGKKNAFG